MEKFKLSKEQCQRIEECFQKRSKKYNQEKVKDFINELIDFVFLINHMESFQSDPEPSAPEYKRLCCQVKKVNQGLKEMVYGGKSISQNSSYYLRRQMNPGDVRTIKAIIDILGEVTKKLEDASKGKRWKHPRVISMDPYFITQSLAKDFYMPYFGKPTAYDDGSFMGVVRIVLEALNLPAEDPSRAVAQAIKNLS